MQRVTIIGLGLIGGSIGMALHQWSTAAGKEGNPALEVIGYDAQIDRQNQAKKMGAVDQTEWELARAVKPADIVLLAVPVREMHQLMADIAPHVKAGAVVTDTGSTKSDVMHWATQLLPRTVSFVGGHPMAGSEQSLEAASPDLFRGATWCLTPEVNASEDAVRTVLGIVAATGAEEFFVDPVEHDAFVGGISHLPAVVSAAMVTALGDDPSWRDMKGLAAGGYRDMSRLAGGSPAMHRDIALTNRDSLQRWITNMQNELSTISALLVRDDDQTPDALFEYFDHAQTIRAEWISRPTRSSEMALASNPAARREGFSEQMGRMLFGNFMRRKPSQGDPGREEQNGDRTR